MVSGDTFQPDEHNIQIVYGGRITAVRRIVDDDIDEHTGEQ